MRCLIQFRIPNACVSKTNIIGSFWLLSRRTRFQKPVCMSYVDWIRVFGNHEMLLFYLMGISCILAIQFISEFSCGQFSVLCVRSLMCIVRLGTSDFSCSLREL